MLRASAEARGETVDLRTIVEPDVASGLPGGDVLFRFANALLGADAAALDAARRDLVGTLGGDALVAASVIAANFSRNDRIANAIGIPLEGDFVEQSKDFRTALGIDDFKSARNSLG